MFWEEKREREREREEGRKEAAVAAFADKTGLSYRQTARGPADTPLKLAPTLVDGDPTESNKCSYFHFSPLQHSPADIKYIK